MPSVACAAVAIVWPLAGHEARGAALARSIAWLAVAVCVRPMPGDDLTLRAPAKARGIIGPMNMLFPIAFVVGAIAMMFVTGRLDEMWTGDVFAVAFACIGIAVAVLGARTRDSLGPLFGAEWRGGAATHAVVRGTVRAHEVVRIGGKDAAFGVAGSWRYSDTATHEHATFSGKPTFEIVGAAGAVTVVARDAVWATTVTSASDFHSNNRTIDDHQSGSYRFIEVVPDGAAAVACGEVVAGEQGALRLVAHGGTPVLLVATDAGGDPLAKVRALRAYWRTITVGFVVVLAAAGALELATRAG